MSTPFSIKTPDDQLVLACKSKDRLAQRYLYEKHFPPLMRRALRYTKNDRDHALDILNRSFLKIFTNIAAFKGENFEAWASRIVVNTAIDSLRAATNYQESTSLDDIHTEPTTAADALNNLNFSDLQTHINQLSTATRTVFILHAIDGYKQQEIADLLKISEGTVKWHFSNAKTLLRQKIMAME